MTSLVLQWLNEELKLHRKVEVLERDLCNGYILAEILHVHGLENHLERYADNSDLATCIQNLELLGKTMASAGLGELSVSTRRAVMMEDRSAILQLLLQVKTFLKSRGKHKSAQQTRLDKVTSRVYEPPRAKDGQPGYQDVEECFVRATAQRHHPKELRFYKDINSAVHLRKFPQAKWTKENEEYKNDANMKAQQAQQNANTMVALRQHLADKREFIQQWDSEHMDKWQKTQDLYLAAERNDLRLEITVEERKRRLQAFKKAEVQRDATGGVVDFEKNMNRLGLGGSTTGAGEPPLRAIPSTDPGAMVHLDQLEKRVEELAFRPSNNVQMMKELRARRKAQLAAEKDRRMRRMRAASESNKSESVIHHQPAEREEAEQETADSIRDEMTDETSPINATEAFLANNRDALEANYSRLREIGTQKRDHELEELQRLRFERLSNTHQRHREISTAMVDYIIHRVFETRGDGGLDRASITEEQGKTPTSTWVDEELTRFTESFLSQSNVWKGYDLVGESSPVQPPLSQRIEFFIHAASVAEVNHLAAPSWALNEYKLVSMITSDEKAEAIAQRVATDHQLNCVQVDQLLDECVKYSYDPVKQAEHALTLGDRERELGVFGPKITPLRQKNTPIPDALVVDVVVAAVQLAAREATPPKSEDPQVDEPSSVVGEVTAQVQGEDDRTRRRGCVLLNFPCSVEEWKLFEKAIIMTQPITEEEDDSARVVQLAALDAAAVPEATADSSYVSCIDAVVVLLTAKPLERDPSSTILPVPTLEPTSAERHRSPVVQLELAESPKRQPIVDPSIAIKAEEAKKALRKQQQVETLLKKTSRVVTVDCAEIDERVIEEIAHLAISVYTAERFTDEHGIHVEICSSAKLPDELEAARQDLRLKMPLLTRIAWMVASKELTLDERSLVQLVVTLRSREHQLNTNLRQLFREALVTLGHVTAASATDHDELDTILCGVETECASVLAHGERQLRLNQHVRDKVLTSTEVALGDIVDQYRVDADCFITEKQAQTVPTARRRVAHWLRVLPLVCLELKEFAVDTAALLHHEFYPRFPFMCSGSGNNLPLQGLAIPFGTILGTVDAIDRSCVASSLDVELKAELARLLEQVVSPQQLQDETRTPAAYELMDSVVLRQLAESTLCRVASLMQWSTTLLDSVVSSHERHVHAMRSYLQRDVRQSNQTIERVMATLAQCGSAAWPALSPSNLPGLCTRHERAVFLSAANFEQLIAACRAAERTHGVASSVEMTSLPQDAFVSAVLDTARRHKFPALWQDATAIARVALVWSDSSAPPLVRWRQLVFSLLCTQFIGHPSHHSLLNVARQLACIVPPIDGSTTITQTDFEGRLLLWFEQADDEDTSHAARAKQKALLFSLFENVEAPGHANTLRLLLACCVAPACPRRVRADLAALTLPQYSRGLHRAFASLVALTNGAEVTMDPEFKMLLAFAGREYDQAQTEQPTSWRLQDVESFLTFCDACEPSLARVFQERDTLSVLLAIAERY